MAALLPPHLSTWLQFQPKALFSILLRVRVTLWVRETEWLQPNILPWIVAQWKSLKLAINNVSEIPKSGNEVYWERIWNWWNEMLKKKKKFCTEGTKIKWHGMICSAEKWIKACWIGSHWNLENREESVINTLKRWYDKIKCIEKTQNLEMEWLQPNGLWWNKFTVKITAQRSRSLGWEDSGQECASLLLGTICIAWRIPLVCPSLGL